MVKCNKIGARWLCNITYDKAYVCVYPPENRRFSTPTLVEKWETPCAVLLFRALLTNTRVENSRAEEAV